jgi:MFS family permease
MHPVVELLRREPRGRLFFVALAQSALGTGAAYVALLLVALDRFDSPWAIGLVLLADVVPSMFLGPLFGAAADRWSRKTCAVVADVLRAAAFTGLVLVDGFVPTLALALVAGLGTGLFKPATLAALPSLVQSQRVPAATSLYGALEDLGFIGGPAIAGAVLLVGGPETILAINGATFAISACILAALRFGPRPARVDEPRGRPSLLRDAREGLVATGGFPGLRILLLATGAALFAGAVFNVGQPLLARDVLDGGESAFAVLVTAYGVGFIVGSLSGAKGGELPTLKRRYLLGAFLMALGFATTGLAPSVAIATVTSLGAGCGNGLLLVYERLLILGVVPDRLGGRVFGIRDAITGWAFATGFLIGPLLVELVGTRAMIAAAGALGIGVSLVAAAGLRQRWVRPEAGPALAGGPGADLASGGSAGEHGPDLVRR